MPGWLYLLSSLSSSTYLWIPRFCPCPMLPVLWIWPHFYGFWSTTWICVFLLKMTIFMDFPLIYGFSEAFPWSHCCNARGYLRLDAKLFPDSLVARLGVQSDYSVHHTWPETAGIFSLIHLDSASQQFRIHLLAVQKTVQGWYDVLEICNIWILDHICGFWTKSLSIFEKSEW